LLAGETSSGKEAVAARTLLCATCGLGVAPRVELTQAHSPVNLNIVQRGIDQRFTNALGGKLGSYTQRSVTLRNTAANQELGEAGIALPTIGGERLNNRISLGIIDPSSSQLVR